MGYLDYPGLQRYHGKVQDEIDGLKDDLSCTKNYFGSVVTPVNYVNPDNWITGTYIDSNGNTHDVTGYEYQYISLVKSGKYCTYRRYLDFGGDAGKFPLVDGNKTYVKTLIADSYDQSTGIAIITITDSDLETCRYLGLSARIDREPNFIEGNVYDSGNVPYAWTVDYANHVKSKLFAKTLFCDGDSIAQGDRDLPDNKHAWFTRLCDDNHMTGHNYAVGGASIYYDSSSRHCISRSIDYIHSLYTAEDVDYLILDGGTNDADLIGSILVEPKPAAFGSWTENDFSGSYDDTTFCGAVEAMFYKAITYFPKSKIGFIIAMEMGTGGNTPANRRAYFEEIIKIAAKWHIPVLDLWKESGMDARLTVFYDSSLTGDQNVAAGKYYYDGQHPTSYGYDFFQNKIQKWMEGL